ncbi:hypothetical protein [Pseudomonas frederiksbergensis]|uniref:hypothetical protein n=1 Tax=Pseudomonas frederiksbergensis TaxID=104087 RepID=UPI000F4A340D|nr:hypothetical protein [Pseudomonas frederiksbergensis]
MSTTENVIPAITSVKDSKGVEVPDGGVTSDTSVSLSGTASHNQWLQILDYSTSIDDTVVHPIVNTHADGVWEFGLKELGKSEHRIKAISDTGVSTSRVFFVVEHQES